jgi:hypothetical protein
MNATTSWDDEPRRRHRAEGFPLGHVQSPHNVMRASMLAICLVVDLRWKPSTFCPAMEVLVSTCLLRFGCAALRAGVDRCPLGRDARLVGLALK